MPIQSTSYFVSAAVIAAKLDQATRIAKQLSLTASNARAVALRAGERAAGFRPLTDFIDRLADITIKSSTKINLVAAQLSKTSVVIVRANGAITRFNSVYSKAKDSPYLKSLDSAFADCIEKHQRLEKQYQGQIALLKVELEALNNELRNAVIVATLSRVEASQAGSQYHEALINVADNVEGAASKIKAHIRYSQQMVATLE